MNMDAWLEKFLAFKKFEGKTHPSILSYRSTLKKWIAFTGGTPGDLATVTLFLSQRQEIGTRRSEYTRIRCFTQFLAAYGVCENWCPQFYSHGELKPLVRPEAAPRPRKRPEAAPGEPTDRFKRPLPPPIPEECRKLLNDHISDLIERGYAESTVETRRKLLIHWIAFAPDGGDEARFYKYLSAYSNPRTRNGIAIHVRGWVKWLAKHGHIARDWSGEVHVKLIHKEDHVLLTPDEVSKIINCGYGRTPLERERNRVMMMVFYSTACRNNELRLMQRSDILWDERKVRCRIKGGRVVFKHLTPSAMQALREYVPKLRGSYLFPTRYKRKGDQPLTRNCIVRLACAMTEAAGLNKHVSPHTFRRSAATNLLRNGTPIEVVQRALDHTSIISTMMYAKIANDAAPRAQDNILDVS